MLGRARERIVKAVVDTGPLLSVLILDYIRNGPPSRRDAVLTNSKISHYLRDGAIQNAFVQLFDGIRTILTTPHVIAEVNSQSRKGIDQEEFWRGGMVWLRKRHLDERCVRLLDMHEQEHWREAVWRIGPVDAGLIKLAQEEGCHLLTDDRRTLRPLAFDKSVNCWLVEEYLNQ